MCRAPPGRWKGQMVAVKVLTHSSLDEPVIERELKLSMTFRHPVRPAAPALPAARIWEHITSPSLKGLK